MISDEQKTRRRQRRELGRSKQLIPADNDSASLIRDLISPYRPIEMQSVGHQSSLAQHMANARAEYRQPATPSVAHTVRRRSNTVSPKHHMTQIKVADRTASDSEFSVPKLKKSPMTDAASRSFGFTANSDYLSKNKRLTEVIKKMDALKERTKISFAEIEQITARCNKNAPVDLIPIEQTFPTETCHFNASESQNGIEAAPSIATTTAEPVASSSGAIKKHTNVSNNDSGGEKFTKKDRISFQVDPSLPTRRSESSGVSVSFFKDRKRSASTEENFNFSDVGLVLDNDEQLRLLKKKTSLDASDVYLSTPKQSQSFRRKSSEENTTANNHIVSILKKKDHNESSSASSNASPVTFSSSVVDTPTRSASKQGILKKRSSLDESRYSRSHSPDERSILVRTPRRNSLEEIQHIGILKQRSYDAKSDNQMPASEPHGILKKKETSTPSDAGYPKHVSISEAVILAAAELCKDAIVSDGEHEIRPILKQDTPTISTPRPILKKKYSSDTEEIRPILKSSRKSSREESDVDTDSCRLRNESPAKRRSFCGDPFDGNIVMERSRSYEVETYDQHNQQPQAGRSDGALLAPVQQAAIEKPLISVAERIKNMERALSGDSSPNTSAELRRSRFKTQPVTVDEISR